MGQREYIVHFVKQSSGKGTTTRLLLHKSINQLADGDAILLLLLLLLLYVVGVDSGGAVGAWTHRRRFLWWPPIQGCKQLTSSLV